MNHGEGGTPPVNENDALFNTTATVTASAVISTASQAEHKGLPRGLRFGEVTRVY